VKGPIVTVYLLKLVRGPRCQGCSAMGQLVTRDTHLCLPCFDVKHRVDERKAKLDATLSMRFAMPVAKIREYRELFGRGA